MYRNVLQEILDCEMLLIGVGEHVTFPDKIDFNKNYTKNEWNQMVKNGNSFKEELLNFYNTLESVISKKNYFIITTNVDGVVEESNINPIRVVAPCGSIRRVQCGCPENQGITETPADFYATEEIRCCSECGKEYIPNVYNKNFYNESGYLKQWNLYNKWLQGTLNRKLLVLELGCGFTMMSLIRMPFEKIVLINQKSRYYRVNDQFPQITAELADRMTSIEDDPYSFVQKLKDCSI